MRFGALIAFGAIAFQGPGAVSFAKSGWPLEFSAEYDTGLVSVGAPYPFDTQGLGAAPLKASPTLTYEYILLAPYGLPEGQAFAEVERQWRAIWTSLQQTISGVSGQRSDLLVADADPSVATTYSAPARILKPAPWKLVRGAPRHLVVELPFAILADFVSLG